MKNGLKSVISVSRRTDIPAFYTRWFINRIRAGYCYVPHPLFPAQKHKFVSLKPDDVLCFVFWTRSPAPLMKYLTELDERGYKYYFQYTILGYPQGIDPYSPKLQQALSVFKDLSQLIGKEKVILRYDPILFSKLTPEQWHCEQIECIVKALKGNLNKMVISFIDPYRKTKLRMGADDLLDINAFIPETYVQIAARIQKIVQGLDIEVFTCAESIDLSMYGIRHNRCIDDELIGKICQEQVVFKKDTGQRKLCGCMKSKDIGVNNTCIFGCKYCYATNSLTKARENFQKHNPASAALL